MMKDEVNSLFSGRLNVMLDRPTRISNTRCFSRESNSVTRQLNFHEILRASKVSQRRVNGTDPGEKVRATFVIERASVSKPRRKHLFTCIFVSLSTHCPRHKLQTRELNNGKCQSYSHTLGSFPPQITDLSSSVQSRICWRRGERCC
jgi:hypothetical protein